MSWISASGVTCQRTQLPLILCWAIAVYKSQGLTLDQAVVDIGPRESLGLTFVALSRTKKIKRLCILSHVHFRKNSKIGECHGLLKRHQEEERLQQVLNVTL
ncbi:hypothetical protein MKX01_000085 [Papaver californicum]|nr:hypothetical protein MKX01_000085 [Papaver californicum]